MTNLVGTSPSQAESERLTPAVFNRWTWLALLALMIGAATGAGCAIFGLLEGLLAADSGNGQAFELFHSKLESRRIGEFSFSELRRLENSSNVFGQVAAYSPVPVTVGDGNWHENIDASFVTKDYFRTIRARFVAGREISCEAETPCLHAILSSRIWQERFASDPNIIGHSILIDGQMFAVRGVLAANALRVDVGRDPQLWIPVEAEPALLRVDWINESNKVRWLLPIVQLRSGIAPDSAERTVSSMFGHQGDFIFLTPGQANLARAFRIRGGVVQAFSGVFLTAAFFSGVFLWALALNRLALSGLGKRVSAVEFLVLALAETVIAVVASLIVKRVLNASLSLFGTPNLARQHQLNWQMFGGIALAFACAGLIVYLSGIASRSLRDSEAPRRRMLSASWLRIIGDHRYLVLSTVLLMLITGYTANGLCVSDFWEHAAVVRELAAHPTHPPNPILPINVPHAGYSPYALALGLFSRATGLSGVDTLRTAGILNVLLLVCTFGLFVRASFPAKHTDFYALLFVLVLWGLFPWYFSGFLHLNALGIVAGNPSTFATGMVFLAWYISILVARNRNPGLLALLTLITADVCLDHPLTAISMFVGLFALTVDFGRSWASMLQLAAVCIAAFLLAWAWPYYDIRALLLSRTGHFDAATSGMYVGLIKTFLATFLALIGVPLLLLRLRSNRRDFVSLIFLCLVFVYAAGWFTGKFTLGRVMPFIVLMLQLSVADWLARYQAGAVAMGSARGRARWTRNVIFAATAVGVIMMLPGFVSSIPIFQSSYGEYKFLPRYIPETHSVLSDFDTSLRIPAFGPKVVAYPPVHVLFFVNSKQREDDDERFFAATTSDVERKQIFKRYGAPFLLLNKYKTDTWPTILRSVGDSSSVVYSDGDMLLLKMQD
ncbi:MAG: ABC transporter permease [Bryobacteraceae bacterium]